MSLRDLWLAILPVAAALVRQWRRPPWPRHPHRPPRPRAGTRSSRRSSCSSARRSPRRTPRRSSRRRTGSSRRGSAARTRATPTSASGSRAGEAADGRRPSRSPAARTGTGRRCPAGTRCSSSPRTARCSSSTRRARARASGGVSSARRRTTAARGRPRARLPPGILGPIRAKPVELPDGVVVAGSSTEDHGWVAHVERWTPPDLASPSAWTRSAPLNDSARFEAIQPTILVHSPRELQALCRSRQRLITETWSRDGGLTWGPMTATALPNPSAGIDAVRLADGRFLLAYNPTASGRGTLALAVSRDGRAWRQAVVARERRGGRVLVPGARPGARRAGARDVHLAARAHPPRGGRPLGHSLTQGGHPARPTSATVAPAAPAHVESRMLSTLVLALLAAAPAMPSEAPTAGAPARRPNILFIMTDDHAAHAICAYGGG